ncbi:MAG TPA: YlcG family protein [Lelliottia sp.]|jgi:hypothetical protein
MIKPNDNLNAVRVMVNELTFPPLRYLRRSMLARQCRALVCADRYLSDRDEKRNASYQLTACELQKEWSWLRLCRFSGSVMTDYRILRNYAARLLKEKK